MQSLLFNLIGRKLELFQLWVPQLELGNQKTHQKTPPNYIKKNPSQVTRLGFSFYLVPKLQLGNAISVVQPGTPLLFNSVPIVDPPQ
jgi:hypothetical protein